MGHLPVHDKEDGQAAVTATSLGQQVCIATPQQQSIQWWGDHYMEGSPVATIRFPKKENPGLCSSGNSGVVVMR